MLVHYHDGEPHSSGGVKAILEAVITGSSEYDCKKKYVGLLGFSVDSALAYKEEMLIEARFAHQMDWRSAQFITGSSS